jgi:hypothetical protein
MNKTKTNQTKECLGHYLLITNKKQSKQVFKDGRNQ